jgi:hypothetical protein
MWEVITGFARWFIPPLDADPAHQYGWRLRLGVFTALSFGGVCGITAFAFGYVPPQYDGFVRVSQSQAQAAQTDQKIQAVITEIRANRAEAVENELLNLRIKHCQAIKSSNAEATVLYWSKISDRMGKFQVLTGRVYALPACTDL